MKKGVYFSILVKLILKDRPEGISKVKFAKIIYLVHKYLVNCGHVEVKALKFVRMPLGPVPVRFMDLESEKDLVVRSELTSLSYNREVYVLKKGVSTPKIFYADEVSHVVNKLISISTSDLVEYTHKEKTWKSFSNGQEYFISRDDFKRPLPVKGKDLSKSLDDQKLQAKLIKGMLKEIVEESTNLEYSDS